MTTNEPVKYILNVFGGVIGPVICLLLDPIVFRGEGYLADIATISYISIAIGVVVFTLWIASTSCNPIISHIIGGILLGGSLVALLFGLVLLPASILGILFWGMGLLGFIPFLTAVAFFEQGRRAIRAHTNSLSGAVAFTPYIPGLLIAAPLSILLLIKIFENILAFVS
jgi:hypothetical protein